MAAFTHLNPQGSRFSDGSYGVFYCARSRDTAIAETRYHSALFLEATKEPPMRQQMRLYTVIAQGDVADIRTWPKRDPALLHPLDYSAGQALGRAVRNAGGAGIVYPSVRDPRGECRRSAPRCCATAITRPTSNTTGTARPSMRYSN